MESIGSFLDKRMIFLSGSQAWMTFFLSIEISIVILQHQCSVEATASIKSRNIKCIARKSPNKPMMKRISWPIELKLYTPAMEFQARVSSVDSTDHSIETRLKTTEISFYHQAKPFSHRYSRGSSALKKRLSFVRYPAPFHM